MSQLVIDEIQGRTSSTVTDINDLKYQIASAWVNFNGTGVVAIRDSYNVSSITDNGTGNYTVNYSNALADSNYCVVSQGKLNDVDTNNTRVPQARNYLTTSVSLICESTTSTISDADFVCIAILGGTV